MMPHRELDNYLDKRRTNSSMNNNHYLRKRELVDCYLAESHVPGYPARKILAFLALSFPLGFVFSFIITKYRALTPMPVS